MKKNYSDDPIYRDAKIVYSDYANEFSSSWSSRLGEKLAMDGIDISELGITSENGYSHSDILKLAAHYSDAVASASADSKEEIGEYAQSLGKKYLPYQEDMIEAYNNLYDEISL